MDYKKILNILFSSSVFLFVLGIGLAFPEKIGLCGRDAVGCIEKFATGIGEPLLLCSFFLAIIFLMLFLKLKKRK
ncbi:MAG: hypothetical protein Greene041614_1030 [Parcubacteria group bacterium Greene0416_14]|nr:MAG: hypothetical protein Greene041614_1030 [Parcubacteria group bacterium Greene0416_14]